MRKGREAHRLAGAVHADETVAAAVRELKKGVLDELVAQQGDGELVDLDVARVGERGEDLGRREDRRG